MTNVLIFYGDYTKAGVATAPSSPPTIAVYKIARATGVETVAVAAGTAVTPSALTGRYYYRLATADLSTYDYHTRFTTTDTSNDATDVPSLWVRWSEAVATDGNGAVALKPAALDISSYTPTLAQLAFRRVDVAGTTTGPVTADTYQVGGFFGGTVFYQSTTLGTPVCVWFNGTAWVMSAVLGTAGAGSFLSGTNLVNSTYTAQGTATGTPAVVAHGNAVLSTFQPDIITPDLDSSGRVTLAPAQAFNNTGQTNKLPATVAAGDGADAASLKTTVGTAGAGLDAIPYTGPAALTDYQQRGVAVTLPASAPAAFLDAITTTEPVAPTAGWNFRQWLRWLAMREANAAKTPTTLTVKTLAGATSTAQAVSDDGAGTETLGPTP